MFQTVVKDGRLQGYSGFVLKADASLYDNVIANGEICMKPYETIVYEVLE